jgi:ACS family hexuronate transporter-like MFS transporter
VPYRAMLEGQRLRQGDTQASYQWVIVAIIWCSHTIYFLNYMTVGTLAPLMKSELDLNSTRIGLLSSAISVGSMLFQVPVGLLADRYGVKWIMTGGLTLVGLSTIFISIVYSYVVIFGLLIFLGAGIAGNQTPGSKAIIMWFSTRGRATGMGIKQAGVSMGGVLAPLLLPMLALQFSSWRYSFAFAGLTAVGSALLIAFFYRDPVQGSEAPFHDKGSYGSNVLRLLKNKDFLLVCVAGIFLMVTQFSLITYLMLYASSVLAFPLSRCGSLLALSFLSGALGRIGWGVVSDYLLMGKRNIILILIGGVGAVTMVGFIVVQLTGSLFLVYLSTVLLGLTGMGWTAIYLTRVGEIAGKDLAGTATGISFVVTNLGAILGPPVFGYLIDFTGTYTASWCFLGFCMAFVVFLSMLQKKELGAAEV